MNFRVEGNCEEASAGLKEPRTDAWDMQKKTQRRQIMKNGSNCAQMPGNVEKGEAASDHENGSNCVQVPGNVEKGEAASDYENGSNCVQVPRI